MGCGTGCCKVILVIFNILFWLFGLGLLCIGVWVKVDERMANVGEALILDDDSGTDYFDIAAWVFIGAGIFAFIVGFLGCCGAIKESQGLLAFYIVCIVLVFAAEIGVAIFVGLYFDKFESTLTNSGKEWVKTSYDGQSLPSKGFNYVQFEFCCCGVEDFLDYKDSEFLNDNQFRGAYMSLACCKPANEQPGDDIKVDNQTACETKALQLTALADADDSYEAPDSTCSDQFRSQGCKSKLIEWAKMHLPIFFGVAAGVALIQIFIFIIAVCMCVQLRRDKN